jgi:hypothetical protein
MTGPALLFVALSFAVLAVLFFWQAWRMPSDGDR